MYNGAIVSPSKYDYVVQLLIAVPSGSRSPSGCTGIVVGDKVVTAKHCCGGWPGCTQLEGAIGCVYRDHKRVAGIIGVYSAPAGDYRDWRTIEMERGNNNRLPSGYRGRDIAILQLDTTVRTRRRFAFASETPAVGVDVFHATYGPNEDLAEADLDGQEPVGGRSLRRGKFTVTARRTPPARTPPIVSGIVVEVRGEHRPGVGRTHTVGGDSGGPFFTTVVTGGILGHGTHEKDLIFGVLSAGDRTAAPTTDYEVVAAFQDNPWAQQAFRDALLPIA